MLIWQYGISLRAMSTRIPFNTEITLEKLQRVRDGERFLKEN